MHFFLFIVAAALTGCSHISTDTASVAERKTDADMPITYQCNSGRIVKASYHSSTTVIVEYEGRAREMLIAISGSGARYVGGGLEWWTKGMGPGAAGTLFYHQDDGSTGAIVEMCVQVGI